MKLFELFQNPAKIVTEGGNIFADAQPFDHAQIPAIMNQINRVLTKANAKALPIGSGATPTPGKISGDLDMIVDATALAEYFGAADATQVRKQLRALFDQAGFQTGQSGVSVHVRALVGCCTPSGHNGCAQSRHCTKVSHTHNPHWIQVQRCA